MKKIIKKFALYAYILYFLIFLIGIIIESDLMGNILSPLGAFIAGLSLLYAAREDKIFRLVWLFAALACLSWSAGDTIWAISEIFYGLEPENIPIFMYIYLLPNLFILFSAGAYFNTYRRRWHHIQLILDAFFTLTSFSLVFWALFLQNHTFALFKLDTDSLTIFLYILTDMFALFLIYLIYLSSSLAKPSKSLLYLLLSVGLYTISDIYYSYLVFADAYIPNSFIDAAYMGSLLLLGYAGLTSLESPLPEIDKSKHAKPENIGNSKRFIFMLLLPAGLITLKGIYLNEIIYLFILFLLHQTTSGYAQRYILNEVHLKDVKLLNEDLEHRIQNRTKELLQLNEKYTNLSKLDSITYLYNRRTILEKLDEMLETLESDERVVIYVLDIVRFRAINATHGHDLGDTVLKAVADRLQVLADSHLLVARLGGDEFVVVEKGFINRFEMEETASRISDIFKEPFTVDQNIFHLSTCIGISCFPTDASNRSTLLRNADMAMYHSKSLGFNKYTFFSAIAAGSIQRRHEIENLLKKALDHQEFHMVYQPQFDSKTLSLIGMEALLRWTSPELGNIPPSEFIPIAEATGLIVSIGEWVIDQSLQQIIKWNGTYGAHYKMGINISPTQLNSLSFITRLERYIMDSAINPEWIDIEITETSTLDSEVAMEEMLTAISALGISISIDDFGTGYSSLSYIKRFDIDRLKIAKPLIDGIVEHYDDKQIVQAIINMSIALDIDVIAEGVESRDQVNLLTKMGCHQLQGYQLGKPVSPDQFERLYFT